MQIEYLLEEDIILMNKSSIEKYGGMFLPPNNLKQQGSLGYLMDYVQRDDYFPTIDIKAAFYISRIITSHWFNDGNKRTEVQAMLTFLKLNGFRLGPYPRLNPAIMGEKIFPQNAVTNDKILENFAVEIAEKKLTEEEVAYFISSNKTPL